VKVQFPIPAFSPHIFSAQGVLPSVDILQKSNGHPIILHLIGGGTNINHNLNHSSVEVPSTLAQPIVTVEKNERGPSMNEIQKILKKNNIQAETREMVFDADVLDVVTHHI
jgi:hypothetical protein